MLQWRMSQGLISNRKNKAGDMSENSTIGFEHQISVLGPFRAPYYGFEHYISVSSTVSSTICTCSMHVRNQHGLLKRTGTRPGLDQDTKLPFRAHILGFWSCFGRVCAFVLIMSWSCPDRVLIVFRLVLVGDEVVFLRPFLFECGLKERNRGIVTAERYQNDSMKLKNGICRERSCTEEHTKQLEVHQQRTKHCEQW